MYKDEYEKVSKEQALVSGAVFLSETERQPFGITKKKVAPNKYNPSKVTESKTTSPQSECFDKRGFRASN